MARADTRSQARYASCLGVTPQRNSTTRRARANRARVVDVVAIDKGLTEGIDQARLLSSFFKHKEPMWMQPERSLVKHLGDRVLRVNSRGCQEMIDKELDEEAAWLAAEILEEHKRKGPPIVVPALDAVHDGMRPSLNNGAQEMGCWGPRHFSVWPPSIFLLTTTIIAESNKRKAI